METLVKLDRLRKKEDFSRLLKRGRYAKSAFISIRFGENGLNKIRVGIVVGNKVSKSAVARNKIKRQLRTTVTRLKKRLKNGFDIVIIADQTILGQEFSKAAEDTEFLLKRAEVLI